MDSEEEKNRKTRLERIGEYEIIFREADFLMKKDHRTDEEKQVLEERIRTLEDYYVSSTWRSDFEADEAGLLPQDLVRGVLSEDGIYDLLDRYRELLSHSDNERNTV